MEVAVIKAPFSFNMLISIRIAHGKLLPVFLRCQTCINRVTGENNPWPLRQMLSINLGELTCILDFNEWLMVPRHQCFEGERHLGSLDCFEKGIDQALWTLKCLGEIDQIWDLIIRHTIMDCEWDLESGQLLPLCLNELTVLHIQDCTGSKVLQIGTQKALNLLLKVILVNGICQK